MHDLIDWITENPDYASTIVLVALYLARAIMPRYPDPLWPEWVRRLWELEARVLVLPWDRWFGRPKLPGMLKPPHGGQNGKR